MPKKLTNEEFKEKLFKINPDIVALDEYKGTNIKIRFKCMIDGAEWITTPASIHRTGCPVCGIKKAKKAKTKTHDTFIKELKIINPNVEVLEKYNGGHNKLKFKCLLDNNEFYMSPANILAGKGCLECNKTKLSKRFSKGMDKFKEELSVINSNIEIVSEEYVNSNSNILALCKIHNHIWSVKPANLLTGYGCPICGNLKNSQKRAKGIENFKKEMYSINPDIDIIGEYVSNRVPILCKCLKCEFTFKKTPPILLSGSLCPNCNHKSQFEKKMKEALTNKNIIYSMEYIFNDCRNIIPLPFDFYLPKYNICIECDGEQHFKPVNFGGISDERALENFEKTKIRDEIKNKYCKNNNIKLIRIPYWEKDNIEQILIKELNLNCQ